MKKNDAWKFQVTSCVAGVERMTCAALFDSKPSSDLSHGVTTLSESQRVALASRSKTGWGQAQIWLDTDFAFPDSHNDTAQTLKTCVRYHVEPNFAEGC